MGANGGVTLHGIGVRVYEVSNVIIRYVRILHQVRQSLPDEILFDRNLKIVKVLADIGDAIGVQV